MHVRPLCGNGGYDILHRDLKLFGFTDQLLDIVPDQLSFFDTPRLCGNYELRTRSSFKDAGAY